MKRPSVEDFKRLTSLPTHAWGMADSDVVDLCAWIFHLEATLKNIGRQKTSTSCRVALGLARRWTPQCGISTRIVVNRKRQR